MTFTRYLLLSAALTFVILFSCIGNGSAQVGNRPACTNYTCRYGECEQLETDFLCHCPPGIKGRNCDLRMQASDSLCASAPCWSGAQCSDNGYGVDYTCACPAGRTGKNCKTIDSAPCLFNNPCRNNAVCRTQANSAGVYCFCVGQWTGQFCDVPIGLCSLSTPCFNGGSCINNQCQCLSNFTGYQCESYNRFVNTDQVVKVLNKGGYVANIRVDYQLTDQTTGNKYPVQQTGHIPLNHDYAFYIPRAVVLDGELGAVFTADAVGGVRILSVRVRTNPECFHIWGTTLNPCWSRVDCSSFKG